MKRLRSMLMTTMLVVSSALILTACGGGEPAMQTEEEPGAEMEEAEEKTAETPAFEEEEQSGTEESEAGESAAAEPGVEVMGISRYSRTELGMRMEFEVSGHQVNENGQITRFDIHRTMLEQVQEGGALLEAVDTEDSTIILEYDGNGDIISARTEIPGYGFTMHELAYKDGLIDTDAYSTDWSTVEEPYKLEFAYEESDGTVIRRKGERLEGSKSSYPCEYEYNENGDVTKMTRVVTSDLKVYLDIEYDENGCVTKITGTNPEGVFLVCEFEYTSLGQVGKADTVRTGFTEVAGIQCH